MVEIFGVKFRKVDGRYNDIIQDQLFYKVKDGKSGGKIRIAYGRNNLGSYTIHADNLHWSSVSLVFSTFDDLIVGFDALVEDFDSVVRLVA